MKSRGIERAGFIDDSRPELRALTGLRGVAATIVALAHFRPMLPYNAQIFIMWQNAAVDLFFCLSGFTLFYVYSQKTFKFSDYLTARVARIYPLYLMTLILVSVCVFPLIIDPITYPIRTALQDLLLQVLMLNSWPIIGSGVHWNFPAWSISVEWFCYILLFPFLLNQTPPRSTSTKLLCLVLLSAASYSLFMNYYDEQIAHPEIYIAKSRWSYWVNLLRGSFSFTAGWFVFASFEKRDGLYEFCQKSSTMIWLGFMAILVLRYFGRVDSQALAFLFPFVVLAAANDASATSRLLRSRPIHLLGDISYSIYMMHAILFLLFIRKFRDPDSWPVSIYILLIGTTFAIAIVTHFGIEIPARKAIRGLQRTRCFRTMP